MTEIDTEAVARSAGLVLEASEALGVGWIDEATAMQVVNSQAAGDTVEGSPFIELHASVCEAAGSVAQSLAAVLESTGEAMYQSAFNLKTTDQDAAEGFKI